MIPTECITCVALPTKQQSVPPMIYRKMLLTQRRLVKISPAQFQGVMIQRSAFQAPRRRRGRFDIFLGMQKQMIFWIYFVLYRTGSELCCDNRSQERRMRIHCVWRCVWPYSLAVVFAMRSNRSMSCFVSTEFVSRKRHRHGHCCCGLVLDVNRWKYLFNVKNTQTLRTAESACGGGWIVVFAPL